MKFVLDNFATATHGYMPGLRNDKVDHRHRFIQGFVPPYTALAAESSDANFKQKVNPSYPLILSPGLTSVVSKSSKYPVIMIANENSALANLIYSTDLWEFFVDDNSETSLGIPSGTPTSNTGIDAIILNGKILTSHPTNGSLYHGAIDASPGWAAATNSVSTGIVKILKNFEDRALVTDSSGGSFTRRDLIKVVSSGFVISSGLTLGDTFDAMDIGTFQDRLALIFCRKINSPKLQMNTIVFVWNGVAGDSYDQKITLRGVYKCSIERDGLPYVFTQVGTTLMCYVFDGAGFREVGRLRNTIVSEQTFIPKSRVGVEGDYFVLLATSPGNATYTAPLYWNPFTGEAFFLLKHISSEHYKALLIAQDPASASYSYKRYLSYQNAGSVGFVYSITLENSTKADMGAAYKSNFIPMPVIKGAHDDMGRGQIKQIEVEYSVKPPSSSDSIALTLTTKDEHESETYTTTSATIKNTTANSTNARVENKRAIIPVGAKATEFALDLNATVSTTSWDLIIRRIVFVIDPIAFN